ncbi:MAG: hypothetical protein LQ350_003158 [Teloschistes chrysophthalmus]|nr:MAG: hypothetical protein LQ350_003158 [Niorma chrysophthalma]
MDKTGVPPIAAAQPWSFRPPSPPHIFIPPPNLDRNGNPDLQLQIETDHDFDASGFTDNDFLNTVSHEDYKVGLGLFDWKYEARRKAQRILPFLYLGPLTAARDANFLKSEGISLLVAIRDVKTAIARVLGSKPAQELGIPYAAVDTSGNQELIAGFPRGIEIINAHLSAMNQHNQNGSSTMGKVLVFCESGNERSAAMVVAYLMAMYSMDMVKAIQLIQAQRFAVAFDDSMKVLLQTYGTILQAKRDVLEADRQFKNWTTSASTAGFAPPPSSSGNPKKRSLENDNDDGMDVDGDSSMADGERFEKREGFAPFFDTTGR